MSYGPGIPHGPRRNQHRWDVLRANNTRQHQCGDCFIIRESATAADAETRWRDRMGNWHTGPIPRCGAFVR